MRLPSAVLGLALAAAGLTPAQATAATTPAPTPVASITVVGRGFGHGRGMSQWGAAQAAAQGRTWQQIVGFYYRGAQTSRMPATTVRTGLTDTLGHGTRVVAQPGLVASDGTTSRPLPTSDTHDGRTVPVVRWEITARDGAPGTALTFVTADGRKAPLAATTGTWTITSSTGRVRVTDATGTPGPTYLGALRGVRTGTVVDPVLVSALDDYVRMVVPGESYGSWPVQALAAQAVAARTYAASYRARPLTKDYDICSSTRCQVVGSITAETTRSHAGVAASAGVVLTRAGQPVRAEFSASNGGWTAAGDTPYLPAQADPYDRSASNPVGSWRATIPAADLARAFPGIGAVTGIRVLARDGHGELGGRATRVEVVGTTGRRTVTGDALRSALGGARIRSTWLAVVPAPSRPTPGRRLTGGILGLAAGHLTTTAPTATVAPTGDVRLATDAGEWDARPGDDVLAVTGTGALRLYGRTVTGLDAGRTVAIGLTDATAVAVVDDLDGDHQRDLLVRRRDGRLDRYTADGLGGLLPGAPATVSTGWNDARSLTATDVDSDGRDDVVALAADGTVTWSRSIGRDVLAARRVLGHLPGTRAVAAQGDLTGDGRDDLLALRTDGRVDLVPVVGSGLGAARTLRTLPGATDIA